MSMSYDDNRTIVVALRFVADLYLPDMGHDDKLGTPKILHVLRVGLAGQSADETATGFLHDLLEDFPDVRRVDLVDEEIPDPIIDAVVALTRRRDESYMDYLTRVKQAGSLAVAVKLNDVRDNLGRVQELDEPERTSLRVRYLKALDVLLEGSPP